MQRKKENNREDPKSSTATETETFVFYHYYYYCYYYYYYYCIHNFFEPRARWLCFGSLCVPVFDFSFVCFTGLVYCRFLYR